MSKRPGFIYEGSNIVIVPTLSFCGPEAKKPKLTSKKSEPEPKVINVDTSQGKLQNDQIHQDSVSVQISDIAAMQNDLASDVTSKKAIKVYQDGSKDGNIVKNCNKVQKNNEAPSSSWASKFLTSIGQVYKKPIKINLSTSKTIPKEDTLRKQGSKEANTKTDESANQAAVYQTNLKVLVHEDEAQKQLTAANMKLIKQSKHPLSSSDKTLIIKNSHINLHQPKNTIQPNIHKHTEKYSSKPKTIKLLPKSVPEKEAPSKKDLEASTSKSSIHKSLSVKPLYRSKAYDFFREKNKGIECTSLSSGYKNNCTTVETNLITSNGNENKSPFKEKPHASEDIRKNKLKSNIETKDTHSKLREIKDKLHDKTQDQTPSDSQNKSKNETQNRNSKYKHHSSQKSKESTSKRNQTNSRDNNVEKYKCSSKTKFDSKTNKTHKDYFKKSDIKSKVIKGKSLFQTLNCIKQGEVVDVLCKSEKRKFKSIVSSSNKIKLKTIPEQTKSVISCSSKFEIKPSEQTKRNEITDLRENIPHRSLSDLNSKKVNHSFLRKRDNNLISNNLTVPNTQENEETETDSKEHLKLSTNMKTSRSKSVNCKTIKLFINVRYEQPTNTDKSSDLSESEVDESNDLSNVDLSFLDDINIDEIINSLKDCENNSENNSKSSVEMSVSSNHDENSLVSIPFLDSVKNSNDKVPKRVLDNSNISEEQFMSNESQNVAVENETFSLQVKEIKTEQTEAENTGQIRVIVDRDIRNDKGDDENNREKSRTHEIRMEIPFEVRTQHDNNLLQKEIKKGVPEIEIVNPSGDAVIDVNSIRQDTPDKVEAAITNQTVRGCTRKGSIHELNVENKTDNERHKLSMDPSLPIAMPVLTELDLNSCLSIVEISSINKVDNIDIAIGNIQHKKHSYCSVTMQQGPSSKQMPLKSLELITDDTCLSLLNNSEVENLKGYQTLIFKCDSKENKIVLTKKQNKAFSSASDWTQNSIDFTVNENAPKLQIKINSNISKSQSPSPIRSSSTVTINSQEKAEQKEIDNNKRIDSIIKHGTGDVPISEAPNKDETIMVNKEKSYVNFQSHSNTNKVNVCDPSYSRSPSPQSSKKFTEAGSGHQKMDIDLKQFTVVNEIAPKLLTSNVENDKKTHSNDTISTVVKTEGTPKLRSPVEPLQFAIDKENVCARKETFKGTVCKSYADAAKTVIETKPTIIVKVQSEERNDSESKSINAKSDSCKLVHSRIISPQSHECKVNNNKHVASPNTEYNFTQGVDEITERILLEQWMSRRLKDEYKVLSVINNGYFSVIYKCEDSLGRPVAAKVMKVRNGYSKKCIGKKCIRKKHMLMKLQRYNPSNRVKFVYLISSFTYGSRWCFVMDYYSKNLKQVLDESNMPFHVDQLQDLSRQLVSAVNVLKNNNILHSDIKPTHIMMNDAKNKLKLCGFDRASYMHLTGRNKHDIFPLTGTVNYRAPELILGHSTGYSIDVWSTALVMYEMATNIILFPGIYNNDILFKQISTLGSIPIDMIHKSRFKEQHFTSDMRFIRRHGPHQQELIDQFYTSIRLESTIRNTYYKYWAASRIVKNQEDLTKLHCFYKLLVDMLMMHPNFRIPIEYVLANPFIQDFQSHV